MYEYVVPRASVSAGNIPFLCMRGAILLYAESHSPIKQGATLYFTQGDILQSHGRHTPNTRGTILFCTQGAILLNAGRRLLHARGCHTFVCIVPYSMHSGRHTIARRAPHSKHTGRHTIARRKKLYCSWGAILYYCTGSATCYMRTGCHASNKQNKSTLYTFLSTTVKLKFKY